MSSTSSFVTDTVTDMISISGARLQADDDKQVRPPFYHPDLIREIVPESPILLVELLYNLSGTLHQKQACIHYLLHYQHYNAEFTISENDQLKYPQALYKPQEKPGYLRTEYNRLIELVEPCMIDSDFRGFYDVSSGAPKEQRIKDFIKLSSTSTVAVLKIFFPQFCFGEINEIYPKIKKPGRKIIIVNLGPKDRLKDASTIVQERLTEYSKILKLGTLRTEGQTISFLFLLKIKDVDCVIMWGAKWASPKKNNQLSCLGINELFGKDIFSLLNKCGVVPDRFSVNQFITSTIILDEKISFKEYIRRLRLEYSGEELDCINFDQMKWEWKQKIDTIKRCSFSRDDGSLIYRDAILKWQEVFFDPHPHIQNFAQPLLISQVDPWLSQQSTIVQWAKAYQNLCEIVMLCLDYFPEVVIQGNLESIALRDLDPTGLYTDKSYQLYSYAMEAIFSVFCQILNREQFKSEQRSIAAIEQNYFETLDLVEKISRENPISFIKGNSLNELTELPDILLIDIHPNNAAKDQLFENNIGGWITQKLEENAQQKIILILDVTLNNFSDPVLQKILRDLNVFVGNGRLEIFCIQSLAKLIQLGADNFSGGACCHLGREIFSRTGEQAEQQILEEVKCGTDLTHGESQSKIADQHIIQKSRFFALLMNHFQEIIPKYFSKVRKNTGFMYEILRERFFDISKDIWIGVKNKEGELESFCATNITLNVDESTVYVAISFKSFFDKVNVSAKDKEGLITKFQKLLLTLFGLRGLSVTGRQSFGFSLSNMSVTGNAIRFSIGVEAESILIQYANIVTDFSFALSEYVAKDPKKFEIDTFTTHLKKIYEILRDGDTVKYVGASSREGFDVDLREEEFDEYGDETYSIIGKAIIKYTNSILTLEIQKEGSSENMIFEPNIGLLHDWGHNVYNEGTYWTYSYLFKLFFQLIAIDKEKLYVQNNAIGGLLKPRCAFKNHSKVIDEKSRISIVFEPEFILELDSVKYTSGQIFVDISKFESEFALGNIPVRLKKLDDIKQSQVFTLCVRYNLNVSPYELEPNSLLLQFVDRKPYLDYEKFIVENFRQGGMVGVVNRLNNLDFSNLPLLEDQSWGEYSQTSLKRLIKILHELGGWVITKITEMHALEVLGINNNELKKAVVQGMCFHLYASSLDKKCLALDSAAIIAKIFSNKGFLELIDYNDFKKWLKELEQEITKNPNSISPIPPYLVAVFPIIKYYYDEPATLFETSCAIALHTLAFTVSYDDLKTYMQSLEDRIPEHVRSRKWKHTKTINNYLRLYIRYPLVDNVKQNLLNAIKEEQEELLKKWIISPRFHYYPIDEHTIRLGDVFEDDDYSDDLILFSQDKQKLKYFFESTGCKAILLNMLDSESIEHTIYISTIRWSIMTQDSDLFNRILENLKQKPLDERDELMNDIKWYVPYLNYNDPIQHELLKVLGHLVRTTGIEASLKVQKLDVVLWQKYQKVEDERLRERDPYYLALIPYRAGR